MIRDNLRGSYPRCHFNHRRKAKMKFETEDEANVYIYAMRMNNYTSYQCPFCNCWHIGKK